jgi:hypothetical protein
LTILYLYKDRFLSDWGLAPKGSFVIADRQLDRPEFDFITDGQLEDFRFSNGEGKNIQLWLRCKSSTGRPEKRFNLIFEGRNKPLKIGAAI